MSEQIFELKGNLFTLSVLHLFKHDLNSLQKQLEEKIAQVPKFFFGAPIVVNLEKVKDVEIDFAALKSMLLTLKLNPVGVCNGSEQQAQAAKEAQFSILSYSQDQKSAAKPQPTNPAASNTSIIEKEVYVPTQVVDGNVRGGQQIYAQNRDLVITGSVSPGAEVIADGNIHVYGSLRGRAIAGAKGQKNALIFCQKLEPELISIDGNYWLSESVDQTQWGKAAIIKLINESLEISALTKG